MKKRQLSIQAILIATSCLPFVGVNAAPVYFAGTGSYYDVVHTGTTWENAAAGAAAASHLGLAGRLATVTSQAENDFIVNNLLGPGFFGASYWIGAYQPAGDVGDPTGGWAWISGEPWSYTNWSPGEPNSTNGNEDYAEILSPVNGGMWNDLANDYPASEGYVIEYVPEPASVSLLLAGVGLFVWRRHNRALRNAAL